MPKILKKNKPKKPNDFKKTTKKIGKPAPKAANYTNTNFKTRKISLNEQTIMHDKEFELTTTRNLSINDLLVQLNHHSKKVRKGLIFFSKKKKKSSHVVI